MEKFKQLENDVRITQDNVLVIHQDLKAISNSMRDMADAVKNMAQIQTDMKLMQEREETRHRELKDQDKMLNARLDAITIEISKLQDKEINHVAMLDKGVTAYKIITWTVMGILGFVGVTVGGIVIWAIQSGG